MIDAEQSYMQPAIDHMVLHLQKRYNKPGEVPIIFNTYQAYLVDARPRIELDIRRAERDGFRLACKLVRGAYMVQERQLAKEHGCVLHLGCVVVVGVCPLYHIYCATDDSSTTTNSYISPVWSTLEGTHASYHTCLELLFDHLPDIEVCRCGTTAAREASTCCTPSSSNQCLCLDFQVLVASHNEDSVKFAVDMMSKRGIPAAGGGVYFGQLLGMCDHVTNTLGARGYQVRQTGSAGCSRTGLLCCVCVCGAPLTMLCAGGSCCRCTSMFPMVPLMRFCPTSSAGPKRTLAC